MESNKIIPKGILFSFILLTTLFFAWAVPNNLTDTMLAAFKRIMSMSDSKTAWIQVVCYLLGYGCCAVPGAPSDCHGTVLTQLRRHRGRHLPSMVLHTDGYRFLSGLGGLSQGRRFKKVPIHRNEGARCGPAGIPRII